MASVLDRRYCSVLRWLSTRPRNLHKYSQTCYGGQQRSSSFSRSRRMHSLRPRAGLPPASRAHRRRPPPVTVIANLLLQRVVMFPNNGPPPSTTATTMATAIPPRPPGEGARRPVSIPRCAPSSCRKASPRGGPSGCSSTSLLAAVPSSVVSSPSAAWRQLSAGPGPTSTLTPR